MTKRPVRWRQLKRAAGTVLRHNQLAQRRLIIEARRRGLPLQEHGPDAAILGSGAGMLGFVNGLFGVDENDWGAICLTVDNDGRPLEFGVRQRVAEALAAVTE